MHSSATATLSTENLLANLAVIKHRAPRSKIVGMVKGNAYGHGIRSVASRIEKHVDILGVATLDEALILRKNGIQIPILLMRGVMHADELVVAAHENIQIVFHHEDQLKWLESFQEPARLHSWLKIDTGMGRLGFKPDEAPKVYHRLSRNPQIIKPLRIFSHLACADQLDNPLNTKQISVFKNLTKQFPTEFSLCNSAGIFNFAESHYDFVRPGLALYGASPLASTSAETLGLKPVMTLQTQLMAVKKMPRGHAIGYGSTFICPTDMSIGIVAIGYADGYPRSAKDGTPVLINNTRCPLIGRVSMDMMAIDLGPCPEAKTGDCVTLWGKGLPIEEIAASSNESAFNLLSGVQNRVKFTWE